MSDTEKIAMLKASLAHVDELIEIGEASLLDCKEKPGITQDERNKCLEETQDWLDANKAWKYRLEAEIAMIEYYSS